MGRLRVECLYPIAGEQNRRSPLTLSRALFSLLRAKSLEIQTSVETKKNQKFKEWFFQRPEIRIPEKE